MKTLLLDAGNTRLKWALCVDGQLSQTGSLRYEWPALSTQLDETLGKLLEDSGLIAGVILSNVAGDKLDTALRELFSKQILDKSTDEQIQKNLTLTIKNVVAQSEAFGVRCAYTQPSQLGADRWAALVAARHHCDGASCIIDCGTAVTVDVLTADGRHAGGVIIPGREMMTASLVENTTGVLAGQPSDISPLAVTSTEEAVQAGTFAATCGAIQKVLQNCKDELGIEPICVVTGGDGERLLPSLPTGTIFEADWVLKGLAIIASSDQ